MERILVPVDGSASSGRAERYAGDARQGAVRSRRLSFRGFWQRALRIVVSPGELERIVRRHRNTDVATMK